MRQPPTNASTQMPSIPALCEDADKREDCSHNEQDKEKLAERDASDNGEDDQKQDE
jgi:hypothetical protein